jgi:hypothetical protein
MRNVTEFANSCSAHFVVIMTVIHLLQSRFKIRFNHPFKAQAALNEIELVFGRIKGDFDII